MKLIIKIIILLLFVTGCGNNSEEKKGYNFRYDNKIIQVGTKYDENQLGSPKSFFENENCAFSEKDMSYIYDNFQLQTYENNKREMIIYSIFLLNDQVETIEGLKVYDTIDDMIRIYGNNYTNEGNLYIYTKDNCDLNIIIQNGIIESIEYTLNNIQ